MKKIKSIGLLIFSFFLLLTLVACSGKKVSYDIYFVVDEQLYSQIGTNGSEIIQMPANPVKDGYTFEGWYWDKDIWLKPFTPRSLLDAPLQEDATVFAYFIGEDDPRGTDLGFKDGVLVEDESVGDTYVLSVSNSTLVFAFTDYVEVCNTAVWTVSKDLNGNNTIPSKTVSLEVGNNIYYVQVTDNQTNKTKQYNVVVRRRPIYTVYFNTNGGYSCDYQRVEEGSCATAPSTSREGYKFGGWDYDFSDPITSDTIINAIWIANDYTITFDTNGGYLDQEEMKVSYDSRYTLPTPTRTGYVFNGWYKGTTPVTDGVWDYTSDVTLKAKWTPATYDIVYNLAGGSISSYPQSYTYGIAKSIPNPTRTGYVFKGWNVNGSSDLYKDYTIPTGTYGNITLYAQWEAATYQITYNVNGGNELSSTTQNAKYDSYVSLVEPTRVGYTFDGWYYGSTKFTSGTWNYASNVTLTAKWNIKTYSITYNLDGGSNVSANPSSYNYETNTITLANPTKKGYTFIGWTSTTVTTPTIGLTIENNSTGNKTFTAHWQINTYKISYDINGGDALDVSTQYVVYNSSYTLITPTRVGYTFAGWYNGSSKVTNGTWTYTENVTLTAHWNINTYLITYILENAVNGYGNPTIYDYETDTIVLADPTKKGYTFIGWTTENVIEPTIGLTLEHNSIGNKTFIAHWEANTYTVEFDTNGGDDLELPSQKVIYEQEYTLPTPTRVGYSFGGWYNDSSKVVSIYWNIANDCKLVAKWIANTDTKYTVYHYLENADDDGYTLNKTEELTGTSDSTVSPKTYTYTGFNKLSSQTVTISADGSLEVYYYYTRTVYSITFVSNGGSYVEPLYSKYEQTLPKDIVSTKEGLTFGGWYLDTYLTSMYNFDKQEAKNITVYAYWEEETNPNYLNYTTTTTNGVTTLSVTGINQDLQTLIIPSHIGGVAVTKIEARAFANKTTLISVTIPTTVTTIGDWIFDKCINLEELTLPYLANTIGYIFTSSSSAPTGMYKANGNLCVPKTLTKVNITNTTSISASAFYGVSNLIEVTIPENVETIGANAFYGCTKLSTVNSDTPGVANIPTGVTVINNQTFYGCQSIAEYNTGVLTSIGAYAFYNNISMEKLNSERQYEANIFEGCLSIDQHAFDGCSLIKYMNVPTTVTSIGAYLFGLMTSLEELTLPYLANTIGYLFTSSSSAPTGMYKANGDLCVPKTLTKVNITNTTSISAVAFYGVSNLIEVTIPENVETIGTNAFYGCTKLSTINSDTPGVANIPTGVTVINNQTFYGCQSIAEYNTGVLTSIGAYAFYNNISMEKLNSERQYEANIFEGCLSIGEHAFYNCSLIKYMNVPTTVTSIGNYAFNYMTSLEELTLPYLANTIGYLFTSSSSAPTGMYKANGNLCVPKTLTKVNITNTTSISAVAFYGVSNLIEVTIPENVETIGTNAFYGCTKLSTINSDTPGVANIPTGVTVINNQTFYGCQSIAEYNTGVLTSIGAYAFYNNISMEKLNSDTQYEANIFEGCLSIGEHAFYNCNLIKYMNVPTTVTSIGNYAFNYMTSLEELTIPFVKDRLYFLFTSSSNTPTGMYVADGNWCLPSSLTKVNVTNTTTIPASAFLGASRMIEINIPTTVTSIGNYAFYKCNNLTTINSATPGIANIPTDVTVIGDYTFHNCKSIVEYNTGVLTSIGAYAFYNNISMEKLNSERQYEANILEGCLSIDQHAFDGCSLIKYMNVPTTITSIGAYVFGLMTSLEELTLPYLDTSISYLFTSASTAPTGMYKANGNLCVPKTLTKINITNTTSIPNYAFYGVSNLIEVTIPENVVTIGNTAFEGCTNLSTINSDTPGVVNIPAGVTVISDYTFYNCKSIESINTGNITTIGSKAFYNISSLVMFNSTKPYEANILEGCLSIGEHAFYNCSLIKYMNVPTTVTSIGNYAFNYMTSLEELTIPYVTSGIYYWFTSSSNTPTGMYKVNGDYCVPKTLTKVNVTNTTTIPSYAFYGLSNLTEVNLPKTLEVIGDYAFYGCTKLSTINSETSGVVNIPTDVKVISKYAFYNCQSIEALNTGDITTIGSEAFYNNISLVMFNSTKPYEVNIPDSCVSIYSAAFSNVKLIKYFNWKTSSDSSIGLNMLRCMSALEELILPNISEGYTLGKLFGSSSYTNSYSASQNGTTYYIPSNLRTVTFINADELPMYFFANCSKLVTVKGLSNIITLGKYAFYNCSSLKSVDGADGEVNISKYVTEIPTYAFANCSSIDSVSLGEVTKIDSYAFSGCSSIVRFNSNNLCELVVGDSVKELGSYAFQGVKLVKNVVVSNNLVKMEISFAQMSALTTLTIPFIPSGYTLGKLFGTSSYTDSTSLYQNGTTYYIPKSLTTVNVTRQVNIPNYAFYNVKTVNTINLLSTAQVEANTFTNCTSTVKYSLKYDDSLAWSGAVATSLKGSGTELNPYLISNGSELAYFINSVNSGNSYKDKYIKLTHDINLNNRAIDVIAPTLDTKFEGIFDGNGYTIDLFKINSDANYTALFGVNNGKIINLSINPLEITTTATEGDVYLSTLVAYNNGVIEDCYIVNPITLTYKDNVVCYVGGLVAYNNGTIRNSYTQATVSATNSDYNAYAGGLVAYNNGIIEGCFSTGNVTAKGLSKNYSRNGGLIGEEGENSKVTDSYYLDTAVLTRYESKESFNTTGIKETQTNIIDAVKTLWNVEKWNYIYGLPIHK